MLETRFAGSLFSFHVIHAFPQLFHMLLGVKSRIGRAFSLVQATVNFFPIKGMAWSHSCMT